MSYSKYYLYKKQVSYDNGVTWADVTPLETQASGDPIATYDTLAECENPTTAITYYSPSKLNVELSAFTPNATAETFSNGVGKIEFAEDVTAIGESAFSAMTAMTSINIPDSVWSIGYRAFYNCTSLSSITIPNSVTSIGGWAFTNCSGLTSITINATTPPTLGRFPSFGNTNDCPIYVPCESVEAYKTAWRAYADRIQCVNPPTPEYRWTNSGWTCSGASGYDKYNLQVKEVSYDSGSTWSAVTPTETQLGTLIEANSEDCGYVPPVFDGKFKATYSGGQTYSAACDGDTTLTTATTKPSGYQYSAMTEAIIGDCVTAIGGSVFASCSSLTSIDIPDSVTLINVYAFQNCTSLTSINIPNSVTKINLGAFYGCTSLTSITIPDSVTTIANSVFNRCSGLTSVTIGTGITSIASNFQSCTGLTSFTCLATTPPSLLNNAFNNTNCPIYVPCDSVDAYKAATGWSTYASRIQCVEPPFDGKFKATYNDGRTYSAGCTSQNETLAEGDVKPSGYQYSAMTEAIIGDCVTTIDSWAFSHYPSLTSITIPNSVTNIGTHAFHDCRSLASVTIGSGVTSIGDNNFSTCPSLTSITISNSVTTIGTEAFGGCTSLPSITIPNSVISIGEQAFINCRSLTSVTIGNGVTSIHKDAFYGCYSLTSVDIPNSVTSIGNSAFDGCTGLTNITIGSGVTTIDSWAFSMCSGLTSITCNAVTPPTLGSNVFYKTNNCPIYVPCDSVNAYKAATGWSTYASRIQCVEPPFGGKFKATYSGGQTYSAECDSSTELTSATTRPSGYDHKAMVTAEIGDCITSIGYAAFLKCKALTSVTIPNSVQTIGQQAFSGCRSLQSITIPNSVTTIGAVAFFNCNGLTSCTIGNSVTSIGGAAFAGCESFTSVTIPNSVTSIGNEAFEYCYSLTSVTIGSGVTSIGESAFYQCSGLTSITCNAVTPPTLGTSAFSDTNNCPIYVPSASVNDYKSASGWSTYASRIQPVT